MPNHEVSLRFPFTVEELAAWDVVVISDAPADSFLLAPDTLAGKIVPNRIAVLGDYVRAGGGFAMIGGWMSFGGFHGKAHWAFSPVTELVPATILPHDDRVEVPEGVVPLVAAEHPVLAGLAPDWPDFLGYNRVTEPSGEVLLSFPNGDPLLVVDREGKGRVAAFTSDILPHWGSPRFIEWDGIPALLVPALPVAGGPLAAWRGGCRDAMMRGMRLGETLDADRRARLSDLALDLVFNGLLAGRIEHMHAGSFPSRERIEADVVVRWGPRRVPFPEVRRIYEPDQHSIEAFGIGRLGSMLDGDAQAEAIPVEWRAEIDPALARRMPEPTLAVFAGFLPSRISRPLVTAALEGPVFRHLCEGEDVPWSPLRRNLETEVRLHGPDGMVRWNMASLISDAEMRALGIELVNRAYTLLLGVAEGRIGVAPASVPWGPAEFEPGLLPC